MPAQYPRGRGPAIGGQGGLWGQAGRPGLRFMGGDTAQARTFKRAPPFRSPKFYGSFSIVGVTLDSAGTPIGNCSVDLFDANAQDALVARTTSDGAGNFSFTGIGNNAHQYFIVAYKQGSPDVAGTTVNTLVAT